MSKWLLSDREIIEVVGKLADNATLEEGLRAVARAQAKKLKDYLDSKLQRDWVRNAKYGADNTYSCTLAYQEWEELKQEIEKA